MKFEEGVDVDVTKDTEYTALTITSDQDDAEVIPLELATIVKVPFDKILKLLKEYCPLVLVPTRVPDKVPVGVNEIVME